MSLAAASALGQAVLAVHLAVIAFNVAGLVAIPLGAGLGWRWVRARGWRALHLACWAVVALQALLGRACVLTIWQDALSGTAARPPLVQRWVERAIYWPLPIWVFGAMYLALFALVVGLWWWVAPSPRPSSTRR
ncbi:MAG: DUF2784 domain-containing protein [Proteobacteria bacterium]|nr:DUF2784 domain-containing protein [Pseudomonadota bacterium]